MPLTEAQIKKAKALNKQYQLSDDDGLFLVIDTSGKKTWKYRYKSLIGKRPTKTLGHYPEIDLKNARLKRDLFKNDLTSENKNNDNILFSDIAEEWYQFKIKNSLGDNPRCGVLQLSRKCIDNDLNPILGDLIFSDIKRFDLVKVIRNIEDRGVKEPVKKACSYLNQIYDYAVSVGYIDFNIAVNLNKIIIKTKVKMNYPYLKGKDIKIFKQRISELNSYPIMKKALLLKLYTGVRGAEVIQARPEHFDLENKVWNIPAIHVKQLRRKALMGFDIPDYCIPLSDQAIEIVRSSLEWSHGERYLFSSPKKVGQHIHFNSINAMIRKLGYAKNELSSHGLRSSMSTVLNDSGLFRSEWIEAQLSHTDTNQTRGAYNHAKYIEHRFKMMQWWANYLDN